MRRPYSRIQIATAILAVAVAFAAVFAFFSSGASSSNSARCGKLAAHPDEPGLDHKGVAMSDINVGEAFPPCSAAAQSEQASAADQFRLGRVMAAKKANAEAANWYRKAAERGYASAQYNLGFKYLDGEGLAQNYAAAREWFRKAADQQHADALLELGVLEWNGKGSPRDKKLSLQHMRQSAALGNAKAKENLPGMENEMRAADELEAYANSLGPFGQFLGAVAKRQIENGYYDRDSTGTSQYDRDAAAVERERERDRLEQCKEAGRHERTFNRPSYMASNCSVAEKRGW